MSIFNIFKKKKETDVFDLSVSMFMIAKSLSCTYRKEICPSSFTHMHCFYREIYGRKFKVADISEDCLDNSFYDEIVSIIKFEIDFNIKRIKECLEFNSKIDCTMKY